MLYVTRVKLLDVRCFNVVDIDLRKRPVGTSILIAGNNGIGKSAILRAVVMGLCDRDSAASLLRELEGNFIRKEANQKRSTEKVAKIEIHLVDEKKTAWSIVTKVSEYADQIIETVEQTYRVAGKGQKYRPFSKFWNKMFCVGYGAGLRTSGNAKYADYFAPDAVYSLFKYDAPLQDPEIAWRRLEAAARRANGNDAEAAAKINDNIADLLKHVLGLGADARVTLEPNGIYVKQRKESVPLDALGDGHKALIKLSLDILVWALLKLNSHGAEQGDERNWKPLRLNANGKLNVQGIVVIDEIEQHLHPKLQREVLRRLHENFPKIQFIVTTHSPLCVSGTADVKDGNREKFSVFSLARDASDDVAVIPREIPRGLRTDQILLDYFELPTTLNVTTANVVKEVRALQEMSSKKRTSAQTRKLKLLQKQLGRMDFSLAESAKDREFQRKALAFLATRASEK